MFRAACLFASWNLHHLKRSNLSIAAAIGVRPSKASKTLFFFSVITRRASCTRHFTAFLSRLRALTTAHECIPRTTVTRLCHENQALTLNLSQPQKKHLWITASFRQRIHTIHVSSYSIVFYEETGDDVLPPPVHGYEYAARLRALSSATRGGSEL